MWAIRPLGLSTVCNNVWLPRIPNWRYIHVPTFFMVNCEHWTAQALFFHGLYCTMHCIRPSPFNIRSRLWFISLCINGIKFYWNINNFIYNPYHRLCTHACTYRLKELDIKLSTAMSIGFISGKITFYSGIKHGKKVEV